MKIKFIQMFSLIIISMLVLFLCFIAIGGIYAVTQTPNVPLNYYLIPLFLIPGILLIMSIFNCYKQSGDKKLSLKLGIIALMLMPSIYLAACFDLGIISGLELMSFIPVIITSALCYYLLKVAIKNSVSNGQL